MKKYFIITPMNEVEYVGEFEEFRDAWDFLNYESNQRFVWLISENSIRKLFNTFEGLLENEIGIQPTNR